MKLAVFMDEIDVLKAYKDTSVAILQSAHAIGWECYFFTQHDLFCKNGEAFANIRKIEILDVKEKNWSRVEELGDLALTYFDIILVRKDPPFNMEYIYAMQALQLAEKQGVVIANKPASICVFGEKTYTLHFPEICPQTLLSKDCHRLKEFYEAHQDVIFKPLDVMGGRGIFHVQDKENLAVVLDLLTNSGQTTIMAQKYIKEIKSKGDKRIILINGEPAAYCLARIPAEGEFRGNLNAGGFGKVEKLSARDIEICKFIAPSLRAHGFYFVGIDVIGDYLTE